MGIITPKVSVLMPAYNAEKYIDEAIESILSQTFSDFEFIIVDDCSTDGTWEIIQKYAERDSRIRALQNDRNLRISRTRNKLIKMAQGKYIVWQDADDVSIPYRIKEQYEFMEANPEVGICGGYLEFFNSEGAVFVQKYELRDTVLRKKIFRYSPVSQGVSIIRTSTLNKSGLYDITLRQAEDLDMSFRLGRISKFANIQKVLLRYRRHLHSTSLNNAVENMRDTVRVRMRYLGDMNYQLSLIDILVNYLTLLLSHIPLKGVILEKIFVFYRKYI